MAPVHEDPKAFAAEFKSDAGSVAPLANYVPGSPEEKKLLRKLGKLLLLRLFSVASECRRALSNTVHLLRSSHWSVYSSMCRN